MSAHHSDRHRDTHRDSPRDPLADSGLAIVDKPAGMTSHDVVAKLRRIYGTRKVGHAGTLDPMATGVLVAGIERGTKFLAHITASTKSYKATIRLGAATTTDDREGEVTFTADPEVITALDDASIDRAVADLTGDIMQRPTAVSAIKINGKRAHERVRAGEDVEIPARPVTVSRFDVVDRRRGGRPPADGFVDLNVEVDCSSGTYIRALARDLGEALGVGGHLTALRRTAVGPFTLADAQQLDDLANAQDSAHGPDLSLSLDEALARCYPVVRIRNEEADMLAMGKWLEPCGLKGVHAAVADDGRAVALVKESKHRLHTVFVARPSTLQ